MPSLGSRQTELPSGRNGNPKFRGVWVQVQVPSRSDGGGLHGSRWRGFWDYVPVNVDSRGSVWWGFRRRGANVNANDGGGPLSSPSHIAAATRARPAVAGTEKMFADAVQSQSQTNTDGVTALARNFRSVLDVAREDLEAAVAKDRAHGLTAPSRRVANLVGVVAALEAEAGCTLASVLQLEAASEAASEKRQQSEVARLGAITVTAATEAEAACAAALAESQAQVPVHESRARQTQTPTQTPTPTESERATRTPQTMPTGVSAGDDAGPGDEHRLHPCSVARAVPLPTRASLSLMDETESLTPLPQLHPTSKEHDLAVCKAEYRRDTRDKGGFFLTQTKTRNPVKGALDQMNKSRGRYDACRDAVAERWVDRPSVSYEPGAPSRSSGLLPSQRKEKRLDTQRARAQGDARLARWHKACEILGITGPVSVEKEDQVRRRTTTHTRVAPFVKKLLRKRRTGKGKSSESES